MREVFLEWPVSFIGWSIEQSGPDFISIVLRLRFHGFGVEFVLLEHVEKLIDREFFIDALEDCFKHLHALPSPSLPFKQPFDNLLVIPLDFYRNSFFLKVHLLFLCLLHKYVKSLQ